MTSDEIAQIYLSPTTDSQNIRPIQLQGFSRVSLEAGESETVSIRLYTEQFGYYSNDGERRLNIDPGQFIIKVGSSSTDIRLEQSVTISGKHVDKPLRDHYFSERIL